MTKEERGKDNRKLGLFDETNLPNNSSVTSTVKKNGTSNGFNNVTKNFRSFTVTQTKGVEPWLQQFIMNFFHKVPNLQTESKNRVMRIPYQQLTNFRERKLWARPSSFLWYMPAI
jgi:hypothetical protein